MNLFTLSNNIVLLKRLSAILAVTCVTLSISNLVLLSANTAIHERIVIVPPGLSGPVALDWGRADAEYIKTFGLFYATLIGTITPRNVEYVADRLSAMTSPTAYPVIRKKLLALSKDGEFMTSGTAINFISYSIVYEPDRNKVFVTGESRIQAGVGAPKVSLVTYEMDIKIIEGRPVVLLLQNYPGDKPRTREWLEQNGEIIK